MYVGVWLLFNRDVVAPWPLRDEQSGFISMFV
jgi:hypothetical protein